MTTLTPWFPASVKPVRVGWYETKVVGTYGPAMSHWDGLLWYVVEGSLVCFYQDRKWRGLADKPEGV